MFQSPLYEAAINYVKNGLAIFPVLPGEKNPLGGHGSIDATKDINVVESIWRRTPNSNIGITAGPNGLWLVDVDFKDVTSEEELNILNDALRALPLTAPRAATANGGLHYYFRPSENRPTTAQRFDVVRGMQVRMDNLYLVAPPSRLKTGGEYRWEVPLPVNLNDIPQWPSIEKKFKVLPRKVADGAAAVVVKGSRHHRLEDKATFLRKTEEAMDFSTLVNALWTEAATFLPPYSKDDASEVKEIEDLATWALKTIQLESNKKLRSSMIKHEQGKAKREQEARTMRALFEKLGPRLIRFDHPAPGFYRVTDPATKTVEPLSINWNDLGSPIVRAITEIAQLDNIEQIQKARTWVQALYPSSEITLKPFAWPGEDCYTFTRARGLPVQGKFPAWEEFLSRLSDPLAFQLFIASIFEDDFARQYMVLYDPDGQAGKSKVINALYRFLGPHAAGAVNNQAVSSEGSRFLLSAIHQKRLVVYPDCKNDKVGMTELVRNITSGDPCFIEPKNQTGFEKVLKIKLIIATNSLPQITGGGADTSRLLPIRVQQATSRTTDFEQRLFDEMLPFIWDCQEKYKIHCPDKGDIRVTSGTHEFIQDVAGELEEEFEGIAENSFEFGPELQTERGMMQDIFINKWRGNDWKHQYIKFKQYLIRRGMKEKPKQLSPDAQGKRLKVYLGVGIRVGVLEQLERRIF